MGLYPGKQWPEHSFPHPLPGGSAPAGIPHSWKKPIHQAPACKFHSVQVSKTPIFLEAPGSLCSSGMYFTGFTWEKDLKPQGFNIADYNWSGNKKHLDMEASHFTLKKKEKNQVKVLFSLHWHFYSLAMTHRRAAAACSSQSPLKNSAEVMDGSRHQWQINSCQRWIWEILQVISPGGIRNRSASKGQLVTTGCIMKGFKPPCCSRGGKHDSEGSIWVRIHRMKSRVEM